MDAIKFEMPGQWCSYKIHEVATGLVEAKASVMSLTSIPFQRRWAEELQTMQLKMEIAGTSRIEGADFSGSELEQAIGGDAQELFTRSQRQARSAMSAYKWIETLTPDRPIDEPLILDIHRRMIQGADDDHCPPGKLRERDQNVVFGTPPHRGVEGGIQCQIAVERLVRAINHEFTGHDPLIRALMAHYYMAAMHPFLDGNGRTARALEALLLQRSGLKDALFIAMSNYYYDEKQDYLSALASVRASGGDLTRFLIFGLKGIELQTKRLAKILRENISKELYRSMMHDFYTRLSGRTRVLGERHLVLANYLLRNGKTEFLSLMKALEAAYKAVRNPRLTIVRDINHLQQLGAVLVTLRQGAPERTYDIQALLDWPQKITETEFYEKVKNMPKAKADAFLSAT